MSSNTLLPGCVIQAESNCYVKSHEPGFRIRLGQNESLIEYLWTKEQQFVLSWGKRPPLKLMDAYRLNAEIQAQEPASSILLTNPLAVKSAPHSQFFGAPPIREGKEEKDNKECKLAGQKATGAAATLPTHTALLNRLVEQFSTTQDAVYQGIVVEQSLMSLAGIDTIQTEAVFGRAANGTTCFKLRFDSRLEKERFETYYNTHYPDFIKQVTATPSAEFTEISVDTLMLYQTISTTLGDYHRSHTEQSSLAVS